MTKSTFPLRLAKGIIYGFGIVILALVSLMSLLYAVDVINEDFNFITTIRHTQPIVKLGVCVAGMILFASMAVWLTKVFGKRGEWITFLFSFIWMIVISAWWIVNAKVSPGGDSKSLYDIAVRAVNGDLAPVAPKGSYLALCPHQTGLLLFFEGILRIFPGADYITIQWVNLGMLSVGYVSAYLLVREWFEATVVRHLWCLLMMFLFPLYFLVPMIYGDIPGLALVCIATLLGQYWIKHQKWYYLLGTFLFACGAVAVRKNYAVYAIAAILALMVYGWMTRKAKFVLASAWMALAILLAGTVPTKLYELRAGNSLGGGIPTVSYVVMGLNHTGWNGYHSSLYLECDYDEEKTAQISNQDLLDTLKRMKAHPGDAIRFFWEKQRIQWAHQSFAYEVSTVYSFDEGRTQQAWEVYSGNWKAKWQPVMDVFQSMVYLGALLYVIQMLVVRDIHKSQTPMWKLVWLITVIGGFFFSLIWEGGARYTLPYFVMLIPYAASGIHGLFQVITKFVKNTCK